MVQSTLLKSKTDTLRQKENRLTEIAATLEENFESLADEDKEDYKEAFTDDGEYIKSAIIAIAKKLKASNYAEDTIESKFFLANKLFAEDTTLKREVKADEAALHQLTKETIEELSDDDAMSLLKMKWINPIIAAMNELPHEVIRGLVTKLTVLVDKYAETHTENASSRQNAETAIIHKISLLVGSKHDMIGLEAVRQHIQSHIA